MPVNDFLIDDRRHGNYHSNIGFEWRLLTDQVMGGVSSANLSLYTYRHKNCLRMQGEVYTKNNGGFVQIALPLSAQGSFDASTYEGIELEVAGNNEDYNIHLRTTGLWFPWQSYRATYKARDDWEKVRIPFSSVVPYKTSQQFLPEKLQRIGLVGIGREFHADLYLASIKFYSD